MQSATQKLPGLFESIESSNAFLSNGELFFIEEVIRDTSCLKIKNTKGESTTASVGYIEQLGSNIQFLTIDSNMICPMAIKPELNATPDDLLAILNEANLSKSEITKGDYLDSLADHDLDLAPFISDEWMCEWLEHHLFATDPVSREVDLLDFEVGVRFMTDRAQLYLSHDSRSNGMNVMPKITITHAQLASYHDSLITALSITNSKERIEDLKVFYKTIDGNWISPKLAVIKSS